MAIADRELQDAYDYVHGIKRPVPRPTRSEVDLARKTIARCCTGMDAFAVTAIYREIAWLEAELERRP